MNDEMQQVKQAGQPRDFEGAKARLEEIANAVGDESLSLDEALDMFEEAVALGLKVSDYIEEGIAVDDEAVAGEDAGIAADSGRPLRGDPSPSAQDDKGAGPDDTGAAPAGEGVAPAGKEAAPADGQTASPDAPTQDIVE